MNEDPFLVATLFEDYATQEDYVLGRPHVIWRDCQIAFMFNVLNNSFRLMFGWNPVAICCGWCLMRMTTMPCKNTCPSCIDWFCYTFPWHQQLRSSRYLHPKYSQNYVDLLQGASWSAKQNIFGVSFGLFYGNGFCGRVIKGGPKWGFPAGLHSNQLGWDRDGRFSSQGTWPDQDYDRLQVLAFSRKFFHVATKRGCLHPKSQDKHANFTFDFSTFLLLARSPDIQLDTFWGGVWLVCFCGGTKYQAWGGRPGCQRKDIFFCPRSIAKPVAEWFV